MLLTILPCTGQRRVSVGLRLRKPAPDCKPQRREPVYLLLCLSQCLCTEGTRIFKK